MKQKDFIMNTASLKLGDEIEIKFIATIINDGKKDRMIEFNLKGSYAHSDAERIMIICPDNGRNLILHTKIISIRKVIQSNALLDAVEKGTPFDEHGCFNPNI